MERGVQRERLLEIRGGLLAAALREPRFAEPEQRERIRAPKRERTDETGFRARVVAPLEQQVAEIRMRFRQRRIQRERGFQLRDGEGGLAEAAVGDRQMTAVRRLPGVRLDRAAQWLERAPRIFQLQSEDADGIQRVGVVRQVCLEDLERPGGIRPIPGLERLERAREEPAVEASPDLPVPRPGAVSSHPSPKFASRRFSPPRAIAPGRSQTLRRRHYGASPAHRRPAAI